MKTVKHKQLEDMAIGWLYARGCSIFAKEVPTRNGIADALGIKTSSDKHTVYYIEAKASRADLRCAKQKWVYERSVMPRKVTFGKPVLYYDLGIDFYYLIIADGVSIEDSLYPEWGVINERGKVIRKANRMKRERPSIDLIIGIAHVLVYKVFGKLYELSTGVV